MGEGKGGAHRERGEGPKARAQVLVLQPGYVQDRPADFGGGRVQVYGQVAHRHDGVPAAAGAGERGHRPRVFQVRDGGGVPRRGGGDGGRRAYSRGNQRHRRAANLHHPAEATDQVEAVEDTGGGDTHAEARPTETKRMGTRRGGAHDRRGR